MILHVLFMKLFPLFIWLSRAQDFKRDFILGDYPLEPIKLDKTIEIVDPKSLRRLAKPDEFARFQPVHTPIYGTIHATAYFFIFIYLGSEKTNRQSVILDTGSSLLGFPCGDCLSKGRCGKHLDPPFMPSESKTATEVPCGAHCFSCDVKRHRCSYGVTYIEGSALFGYWLLDRVTIIDAPLSEKSSDPPKELSQIVSFGCHTLETHKFFTQVASGILGLEFHSGHGLASFVNRINERLLENALVAGYRPLFSICISGSGGSFGLGTDHNELHTSEGVWATVINQAKTYTIQIYEIYVGSTRVHTTKTLIQEYDKKNGKNQNSKEFQPVVTRSPIEALVDSGTTVTYVPTPVYHKIIALIETYISQKRDNTKKRRAASSNESKGKRPGLKPADALARTWFKNTGKGQLKSVAALDFMTAKNSDDRRLSPGSNDLAPNAEKFEYSANTKKGKRQLQKAENYDLIAHLSEVQPDLAYQLLPQSSPRRTPKHYLFGLDSSQISRRLRPRSIVFDNIEGEQCWFLPEEDSDFDMFPTISIRVNTGSLRNKELGTIFWSPTAYLYAKGEKKYQCLAITADENSDETVLGASFFVNKDVVVSLNAEKIGFFQANCPKNNIPPFDNT